MIFVCQLLYFFISETSFVSSLYLSFLCQDFLFFFICFKSVIVHCVFVIGASESLLDNSEFCHLSIGICWMIFFSLRLRSSSW